MDTTKHTETPWTVSKVEFTKKEWDALHSKENVCVGLGMNIVAIVYGPKDDKPNASFIVRACNSHDALLDYAKTLHNVYAPQHNTPCEICDMIALAEGA